MVKKSERWSVLTTSDQCGQNLESTVRLISKGLVLYLYACHNAKSLQSEPLHPTPRFDTISMLSKANPDFTPNWIEINPG